MGKCTILLADKRPVSLWLFFGALACLPLLSYDSLVVNEFSRCPAERTPLKRLNLLPSPIQ
jgi:hypothetical protein